MSTVLHTERLVLRVPQRDDAERITAFLGDFGVSGNLARVPHPYVLRDAKAWLRTRDPELPPEETVFAIDLPGEGLVGHIGYHRGAARRPVLGYWLGRPYWNLGLMSEAGMATVDWFFRVSDERVIVSGVFDFNLPSLAVQQKLGFVETGRSRLLCLARGQELGHIDTELTRTRWIETRQQ